MKKDKFTESIFGLAQGSAKEPPLADRMRPRDFDEFVGQNHLLAKDKLIWKIRKSKKLYSLILWGPPGSGKTTLARLLAAVSDAHFVSFSAVLSGVKEVREVVEDAKRRRQMEKRATVLFVDEVHRFNKAQQDAFLPHVEDGTLIFIGATTENPSFEVIAPLLSRCRVITLTPLADDDISKILTRTLEDEERGLGKRHLTLDDDARALIIESANGDARSALNTLEICASFVSDGAIIKVQEAAEAVQRKILRHDKTGEEHYNVVSAFIKSMRGSDPDASVYWLARLIDAGEDPRFIARRMIIFASEDIGNADPVALMTAVAAAQAVEHVGMPEAAINLAHACTYLAGAPKSNASYMALNKAREEIEKSGALDVPLHLRNAPTKLMEKLGYGEEYKYPHDFPDAFVRQQYLPDKIKNKKFYEPTRHGREKLIAERLESLIKAEKKKNH